MATQVTTKSVAERLRRYVDTRARLEEAQSLQGLKWAAGPMRGRALALFPRDALADLRRRIEHGGDRDIIVIGGRRIREKLIPSANLVTYCPADRIRPMLRSPLCQPLDVPRLELALAAVGATL